METSKFDWTLDEITIEKISKFLEWHRPLFEFDSRSFNCSMSKEGSSGVIGERNSMQSTGMKYQFYKTFPLLIKLERKFWKTSFWPRFGTW